MNDQATRSRSKADPSTLTLEFRHVHRLFDPSAEGVQTWQISLLADDETVGSLRATRGLYWKADNLRERMADEQSFLALVAEQLLDEEGKFRPEFEDFVDMASSVLVVDELDVAAPWNDSWIIAGLAASVIDRLTDNQFAVVFPHAASHSTGAALLAEAATLLSAEPFSDDLLIIDTALAAPEEAAHRVRERLRDRARYGGPDPWSEEWDEDGEGEEGEEGEEVLTARTRSVLRVALQDLSDQAWEEVAALGDEPLPRGAGGLFGSLPPVTLHQDGTWRRNMARSFDDLVADLSSEAEVEPRCTAEEMALHLGIARARDLTRNRPRRVQETVGELPEHRRDFDWHTCSDLLFQDHDVLMLFDNSLDGIEDSDSQVNQTLGMVNLAAQDWFDPFAPELARDHNRRFRHQ